MFRMLARRCAPVRAIVLVLAVSLLAGALASCSSRSSSAGKPPASTQHPSATTSAATSAHPSPATSGSASGPIVRAKGPATAQIALAATAGITGPLQVGPIECGVPGLAGTSIVVVARPAAPGVTVQIIIFAKAVLVVVVNGSGSTAKALTFVGAGIATFDAAAGARVSSQLLEAKPQGSAPKSGGAVSASVNCGNQGSGQSTMAVVGPTGSGLLTGDTISPAKVTCTALPAGADVRVTGLTHAGATAVLVTIDVRIKTVTVSISAKGGATQTYSSSDGTATATAAGVEIDRDVSAAGASHSLHVKGSATCSK